MERKNQEQIQQDVEGAVLDEAGEVDQGDVVTGRVPPQDPYVSETLQYTDHFLLKQPTSDVRFRGNSVHLYDLRTSQIQLMVLAETDTNDDHGDDFPDHKNSRMILEMKEVGADRSTGLSLLRATYALVALFFAGILFAFSFLVILFLFMDLVADAGLSGQEASWADFVGTLFALPVILYGLSSVMTIAGFFVMESWNGFLFLHTVGQWNEIFIDWVTLVVTLVAPLLAMICSLFARLENWWTISFYTWFSSMSVFFVVFAFVVVFYETQAAWLIVKELEERRRTENGDDADAVTTSNQRLLVRVFSFVMECMYWRQNSIWSGRNEKVRISSNDHDELVPSQSLLTRWYTFWTLSKCGRCLFEAVDPPEKIFSMQEILRSRRFVTRYNWSLERIICSNRKTQGVLVIQGPAALKKSQIMSSLVCFFLSVTGSMLLVIAFMVWAEKSALPIILFVLLICCCCFSRFTTAIRFYRSYRQMEMASEGSVENDKTKLDDGVYQSFETYRVSRPSKTLRIVSFALNIGFFFIWPIVTLIKIGNYHLLGLFILIAIWAYVRFFLDPCCLLKDLGHFDVVGRSEGKRKWRVQSRVSTIMMNVTRSPGTNIWMWTFLLIILVALVFSIGSVSYQTSYEVDSTDLTDDNYYVQDGINHLFWNRMKLTPLGDFVYPPQENLQYPTCRLYKGLEFPNGTSTALADYAFLATLVYQAPETLQDSLDEWFGPDFGTVEFDLINQFRMNVTGGEAAVSYQVVSFPNELSVVVVRGSTTSWEWMTNAQLWAAVALVEVFQFFLPAGEVFNPILHGLLKAMVWIESEQLANIALYSQTTQLVQYMRNKAGYTGPIHITGQSLGGGISLITGAQTNIPAIAISGPNNVFSRATFVPPLDLETIDTMLFNVIPERDIVPMTDQPGLLTQNIACRAKTNDLAGCHTATRTLCEIMYKCGSFNRPPPCECAVKYGYPDAQQVAGNQTYSDVCGTKRSNDGWYA